MDDSGSQSHDVEGVRATAEMCLFCFDLLIDDLVARAKGRRRRVDLKNPPFAGSLPPSAECPLFVTWDKRRPSSRRWSPSRSASSPTRSTSSPSRSTSSPTFELRGCIGTLSPRPLQTAIGEYALTSAFRDRRFDPISDHEVPHLRVAVSLLVDYEECSHCHDWTVGVHGIIIKFTYESVPYSATYLPEVPLEQGWTQEEAVESLVRKAGFRGEVSATLLSQINCTRYQSSKHRLTYQEYVAMSGGDPFEELEEHKKSPQPKQRSWRPPYFSLPFNI